ncbi:head-tail joining protein [Bartonella schoenbuchensis]|uniref:Phage protein n=3 Tax=Bartonella schoenbuchensis TaxID=165694 RepID=E6YYX5_BARSR|nr:hypothetical protein [Bartonella schoenbuchensis]ENN90815.1 hypothetical protein m07a_08150 [Bartonella schoenbuchensis m07a]CBI82136.1 conserved hypothetical protein [Bartonella schoenbuchensis R1]CBI82778.1 conserved hypothetical protein [Bartonella schoenbuchensis R1]
MQWYGLLSQMIEDVRDTFGQPVIYTRKKTGQSFHIIAIYSIKHAEPEAGGRVKTTIPRKELDVCINDIGGVLPELGDRIVLLASQENFSVANVQASESNMYKLILREDAVSDVK